MAQPTPPTKDPDCFPGDDRCVTPLDRRLEGASIAVRPPRMPFAWQHGQCLLMLDQHEFGWTVAELRFEPDELRYVEVRRSSYRWPREAMGAVIARGYRSGETLMAQLAGALDLWLKSRQADRPVRAR